MCAKPACACDVLVPHSNDAKQLVALQHYSKRESIAVTDLL